MGVVVTIELQAVQSDNTTEEVDPVELQAAFAEVCPRVAQTVHEKKATWVIRVKYYSPHLRGNPLRNSYSYELFKRGERKPVHSASHKIRSGEHAAATALDRGVQDRYVKTAQMSVLCILAPAA